MNRNDAFWTNYYRKFVGWTITDVEIDEDGFVGLVMVGPDSSNDAEHIVWLYSDPEGNGVGFLSTPEEI